MNTVVQISLSGHPVMFRVNEDAYEVLRQYLERARLHLTADPDHDEVLRDLEQSIGEKLTKRLSASDQVVGRGEVEAVLAEVGPVETGSGAASPLPDVPAGRRRLVRIQEGQEIFGVCTGLAAYSNIRVDWVRLIFMALTTATGGAFALVYIGLGIFLPVVPTRAAYLALPQTTPTAPLGQ